MTGVYNINLPVALDGPRNFRELGGYPAEGGHIKRGVIFRSDGLQSLTDSDRQWMLEHGISCVIDLRSDNEATTKPDAVTEEFEHHHIAMSDRLREEDGKEIYPDTIAELYKVILNTHKEGFAKVMRILIERNGRPAVFHCAVGKDRTGITAMLILWLCGVPEDIIVADYEVSEHNMKPIFDKLREMFKEANMEVPDVLLGSRPQDMRTTMDYIRENWGSAAGYLGACGLSKEELQRLCEIFVDRD